MKVRELHLLVVANVVFALALALVSVACFDDQRFLGTIPLAAGSGGGGAGGEIQPPLVGPFGTPRLIAELSGSETDQYDAALSADRLQILYRSEPRRSAGSGRSEILMATRSSAEEGWATPRLIEEIDAQDAWNLSPDLSLDGLTLWLSSDRATTLGGLDLWFATRQDPASPWSTPQNVSALNTADWDTDCGVDASQLSMIFSRREGEGADLFSTRRETRSEPWSTAEPLTELNSAYNDWDAAFANDGLTLMFASDRSERPGLSGALHIYEATRASKDVPFSAPVLLEELAAAGAVDEDPWLSNDGRHVVWSSTREGRRQLYEAFR